MAKIEITKTELVWPGKYDEEGNRKEVPRVSLPFQVIETVNESRASREAAKAPQNLSLFDIYQGKEGSTFEEGWRNKLIWGDNLLVMGSLLRNFAGKIDLIYIDPPFATGADFSFTTEIGGSGEEITKEQSAIEEKAYRDTWGTGVDSYLQMIHVRINLAREILAEHGAIYVHCDWRLTGLVRLMLDDVFGRDNVRNEIRWKRQPVRGAKATGGQYARNSDTMFFYSKSQKWIWNGAYKLYDEHFIKTKFRPDEKGRLFRDCDLGDYSPLSIAEFEKQRRIYTTKTGGKRLIRYLDEEKGESLGDIWTDIPEVNAMAAERTGYETQKPEALLERIIKASSNTGDLVADFFCGSGTTMAVAEKLGRRWIGCDLGRYAIHVSRKRLLEIENCKPFEILNLGKYERQYWQGVTFGDKKGPTEQTIFEYLAFILKLYQAQPVSGLAHLHGKKGRAMVHVGAVDAPVTIDEINAAIAECLQVKQKELHILGWEWEMGLANLMVKEAERQGVKLLLLQIPREVMEQQAVDKEDVRFFELAYLDVKIRTPKKLTAQIALEEFVIPNTELVPEEVRAKVKKWSDYIDYWAVDWDFRNDTFMQGWVTYRTRQDRTMALVSDPHIYAKAGKYRALVKVVDIFGNDTSQAFDVEVA